MYQYNPWKTEFKEPFGAVENHSTVKIRFFCDEEVTVKLIIHRDAGARYEFDMPLVHENFYETTVPFDRGRGLYFYHFETLESHDWGTKRLFYGRSDLGGEGHVVEDETRISDFQLTVYEGEDTVPDWYKEAVCYQIFPDRFANGNANGSINAPKKDSFLYATMDSEPFYIKDEAGDIVRWDFYGGNLRGIIQKIPYLQDLGINMIYLNPIFLARSNHRYDTSDYLEIDPMLGSEEDFRALVEALHAANMRLILDGVFSHVGQDSRYFNIKGTFGNEGAVQDPQSPYMPWFKFVHYPFDYKSWWGIKDLPEVDKNNPSFRAFIYGEEDSVLTKWNCLGVDGWRLDVADELPDDFIRGIRSNLTATSSERLLIGEVWEDASNKVSYDHRRDYILGDALQGVMNYPLRDLIIHFVDGNTSAREMAYRLTGLQENYPSSVFYGNLNNLGTHDTERILTMVGDDHMELAVGLLFVMPGVPCIYYGDEAGLTGRKDPANRKFFPWDDIHQPIWNIYKRWTQERLQNQALQRGSFAAGYYDSVFTVLREYEGATCLYLANPSEETRKVKLDDIQFLTHEKLSNITEIEIPAKSDYFYTL